MNIVPWDSDYIIVAWNEFYYFGKATTYHKLHLIPVPWQHLSDVYSHAFSSAYSAEEEEEDF